MGDRKSKLKLAVLVSGNGSNLQAILDGCDVEVVISNNPKAFALERAKRTHVPNYVVENNGDCEPAILKILAAHQIELVCLAGFMKILSQAFVKKFPGRIINIHPSLLPAFPGLNAQRQALEQGAKITGATVHFVDEGCDTGPIILQSAVPILDDDIEATLRERILKEEHKIYVKAIGLIANQCLKIVGRRVLTTGQRTTDHGLRTKYGEGKK